MQDIVFVVEGDERYIRKHLLLDSLAEAEGIRNNQRIQMPEWVSNTLFDRIETYISKQVLPTVSSLTVDDMTKLLKLGDLLYLDKFLQGFINDVLVPNLNEQNVFRIFLESQKKLKQSTDGPKHWYNLLNSCTSFIAQNIYDLYEKHRDELSKVNQKILTQVFDRALKLLKKKGYVQRQQMFNIIMRLRGCSDVAKLCQYCKEQTLKKKINQNIHANLAWKLVNLKDLQNKKTKIFKFIDYEWRLSAQASFDHENQKKLTISLLLQRPSTEVEPTTNTLHATSQTVTRVVTAVSSYSTGINTGSQHTFGNDFGRIGVLYIKLVTKIQQKSYESQLRVSFINIVDNEGIDLLEFNRSQLNELGSKRVDLTVFCNLDQVYTFVLNYIVENKDPSILNIQSLAQDEILALIKAYKQQQKHREAFMLLHPLLTNKNISQDKVLSVFSGINFNVATAQEKRRLQNVLTEMQYERAKNDMNYQMSQSRRSEVGGFEMVKSKTSQVQNMSRQLDARPIEMVEQDHIILGGSRGDSRGRGDSRSRVKKIFESSRRPPPSDRNQAKSQLLADIDIRRFIYQKDSVFFRSFD